MATTRDQAYQQYQDIYRNYGRGDLLEGDYAGEAEREFGDWWKNASADSGELQGSQYQQTWESLVPQLTQRIYNRVYDGPDSQGGDTSAQAAPQTPTQQWNAQPVPTATPAVPTASPAMPAVQPTPFGASGEQLIQLLMQRAQSPTVSRTDPNVRAQADAYGAEQDRAARNFISDMAERQGPFSNIDGYRQMAYERAGQNSGAFEAELLARELDAQRGLSSQALGMWGGLYSGDQGLDLSRELGYLANNQRTADRDVSMDQFLRELALREFDLNNRWDYNWLGFGG